MATTALVDRDLEIGRRILTALARARIAVNVAFWAYIPQIGEWQLFIATPLVDSKGHRLAYEQVLRTLQNEGIDEDLPWRRILLRSPKDPVLKSMEKQSREYSGETFRVLNAPIGDRFVEDAYLYKGFISIIQSPNADSPSYSVFYVPYEGPGGILPDIKIRGVESLSDFLRDRLHFDRESIHSTLRRLAERGNTAIPNVELKRGELKRLGLVS